MSADDFSGSGDTVRVFKVELMVVDFEDLGEDGVRWMIENTRYPNHAIAPSVSEMDSREVVWKDDGPLNNNKGCFPGGVRGLMGKRFSGGPDLDALNTALRLGALVKCLPVGSRLVFRTFWPAGKLRPITGKVLGHDGTSMLVLSDAGVRHGVLPIQVLEVFELPSDFVGTPMALVTENV